MLTNDTPSRYSPLRKQRKQRKKQLANIWALYDNATEPILITPVEFKSEKQMQDIFFFTMYRLITSGIREQLLLITNANAKLILNKNYIHRFEGEGLYYGDLHLLLKRGATKFEYNGTLFSIDKI